MATKFYLPSSGAAAVSPTPDSAWENTSINTSLRCVIAKSSTAMTTVSFTDTNNTNQDILFRQYVSDPITAQTISSQTITFQIRAEERLAGNNLFTTLGIRVCNNAGTSITGTILAVTRDATEVTVTSTFTNRSLTATTNSVTANAGDRIVIEIGLAGDPANSGGADHDGDLRIGDNAATDLPVDDSTTSDNNPYVSFGTSNITWQYNQSTSMTAVGTQTLTKRPGLIESIVAVGVETLSKVLSLTKSISITAVGIVPIAKTVNLIISTIVSSGVYTFSSTLVKYIISSITAIGVTTYTTGLVLARSINIVTIGIESLGKQVNTVIVSTAVGITTLVKQVNSIVGTLTAIGTMTRNNLLTLSQTMSVIAIGVASSLNIAIFSVIVSLISIKTITIGLFIKLITNIITVGSVSVNRVFNQVSTNTYFKMCTSIFKKRRRK